jgi:hypothetical protein
MPIFEIGFVVEPAKHNVSAKFGRFDGYAG